LLKHELHTEEMEKTAQDARKLVSELSNKTTSLKRAIARQAEKQ
jgi:hypothetical protein